MSSRWLLALLLVPLLSSIAFSQKLINGFTREFAIQGLPAGFAVRSFDVNNDSQADIVVGKTGKLLILDGKTFDTLFLDATAPAAANLSQADANRDGILDIVATDGASGVIVWYGPDFLNRRIYTAPVGSSVFALRNREDGQVEFTYGFSDQSTTCQPVPAICTRITTGHLIRYVDTIFTASPHISLGFNPQILFWQPITSAQRNFFSSGYFSSCTYSVSPGLCENVGWGLWIGGSEAFSGSYNWRDLCALNSMILQDYKNGNLDADSAREAIEFIFAIGCCSPCTFPPYFRVRDLVTGSLQWSRTDISGLRFVSVIDMDGDSIDELLAYKVQGNQPVLYEFQVSNGATLGFTPLPFRADTMIVGLFGQPAEPKLLLTHGDSLVVFGVDAPCATALKGDLNGDGSVTVFDVTLELNCAFLGEGNCDLCFADVNCDDVLSAADVVLELLAVFLQRPFPCS